MKRAGSLTLCRGDAVGVVSTGFAVKRGLLEAGLERLTALGFRPLVGEHVLKHQGYLAGSDDERIADLAALFARPDLPAIWFARGGYGTARLLDRISWGRLRRHPKLLIGYSDLTALFGAAVDRAGCRCLYGPVVTEMGDPAAYHRPSLLALLEGRSLTLKTLKRNVVAAGRARGRLAGGNLTVLTHLCGTRFMPDLDGAILFFEEVGESVYRIDRMLTQLRQSGALSKLAGVLIGGCAAPPRRRFPPDRRLDDVFEEFLGTLGVPVVRGLAAGHVRKKKTLPLGSVVTIDTAKGRVHFEP